MAGKDSGVSSRIATVGRGEHLPQDLTGQISQSTGIDTRPKRERKAPERYHVPIVSARKPPRFSPRPLAINLSTPIVRPRSDLLIQLEPLETLTGDENDQIIPASGHPGSELALASSTVTGIDNMSSLPLLLPKKESVGRSKSAYEDGGSESSRSTCSQISLTDSQVARLEERRKFLALQELEAQIGEERIVEAKYQQLDEQTRVALKEREGLTKRMLEERRLRNARRELEEARLVTAMVEETEGKSVTDAHRSCLNHELRGSEGGQPPRFEADLSTSLSRVAVSTSTRHTPTVSVNAAIAEDQQSLTPSPFRELPMTGLRTGRHPRSETAHEGTYVPNERLVINRGERRLYQLPLVEEDQEERPGPSASASVGPVGATGPEIPIVNRLANRSTLFARPEFPQPERPKHYRGGEGPMIQLEDYGGNQPPHQVIIQEEESTGRRTTPGQRSLRETDMMELLVASAYGLPKPRLPYFDSGRESDFVLLDMALGNLVGVHSHLSEHFKFQILLDHLKLPSAHRLAKSFMYANDPYTAALTALRTRYGQPRQLIQSEINNLLSIPSLKMGDNAAFQEFTLAVSSLVGLLRSVEGDNGSELKCGSHVDKLLGKLPPSYRDGFVEHCYAQGFLKDGTSRTYTLQHLSLWLQVKARARTVVQQVTSHAQWEKREPIRREAKSVTNLYLTTAKTSPKGLITNPQLSLVKSKVLPSRGHSKFQPYCPFHNNREHFFGSCPEVMRFTPSQLREWIIENKRCYKCARCHLPEKCTLRKPCNLCSQLHLTILHDFSAQGCSPGSADVLMVQSSSEEAVYVDLPNRSSRVLLKIVPVTLYAGSQELDTFALLDDASSRTIILTTAGQQLKLRGKVEILHLQTIRQQVVRVEGRSVSFSISPAGHSDVRYPIHNAFTAPCLNLAEYSCPAETLKRQYPHLRDLPLPAFAKASPLVLIGSDFPHLIVPIEPVRMGSRGGPLAVHTALGWAVQGPVGGAPQIEASHVQSCHFLDTITDSSPGAMAELLQNVELLWKLDAYPHRGMKDVTRSKNDKYALELLQTQTTTVLVDGIKRYATPLLRTPGSSILSVSKHGVMALLRGTERRLAKDPELAKVHQDEIQKLLEEGYVSVVKDLEGPQPGMESWYLPHHVIQQASGKYRLVFNCSFTYEGQCLNSNLLPGPILGPSLLGVLLRFRQHSVAISGDIRSMFHQVRLLPQDRSLLRFIWRNLEIEKEPTIYEWQVLPFGATCSPCCAIYALQCQARECEGSDSEIVNSVENSFYVDNCLQCLPSSSAAKTLLEKLRLKLASGGFEIKQRTSNVKEVTQHLPPEARSTSMELWLSQNGSGPQEPALGLRWSCIPDTLGYQHRVKPAVAPPTLRIVYRTLASQYDPLGYILPYTTRAKVIVQDLWKIKQDWDDPIRPVELMDRWLQWERELADLHQVRIPRCYVPASADSLTTKWDLHIYCDASERVYGAVAYLRAKTVEGTIHVSFAMAKSRVAPKKQISIPRLELCAALLGAQLSSTLQSELTLPIQKVIYWSDSTTVLAWLRSESCRYKVFVGTRIAEIQDLTDVNSWRYVDSQNNPADDLTRGKSLQELVRPDKWSLGPSFLRCSEAQWPAFKPASLPLPLSETDELRRSVMSYLIKECPTSSLPDIREYDQLEDLIMDVSKMASYGAAAPSKQLAAEVLLLQRTQAESFPEELRALQKGKDLPRNSRLISLSPELDPVSNLIRVGGRLRQAELEPDALHPIILDGDHPLSRLLIKSYDEQLLHPGSERLHGEMRRKYWMLKGRGVIRKYQNSCQECRKWRATPEIPKMADLPVARLRLFKPPFWSTGVDCFGPFQVKVGRRVEKRWGIIFKCLTTRCIHLDLLENMDAEAFLMALRRFIARRGKPFEILADRGTNFRGGEAILRKTFQDMEPTLQQQLAGQQITFHFNPPHAPHFGGVWEREIRSIKSSLRVVLGSQPLPEIVLRTVFIEVEGIMNSKPLGYVSADPADLDPITPNVLLMGRRDSSLPQAIFAPSSFVRTRRWRHSQLLADHFWSRFIRDYLPSLQPRGKWRKETSNMTLGQIVLIVDSQFPRSLWPVGRVTQVISGVDGRIRTVEVTVGDKVYIRPVARLIPLPELKDEAVEEADKGDG